MFKKVNKIFRLFKLYFYIIKSNQKIKARKPQGIQLGKYAALNYTNNGSIKFIGKFYCRRFVSISCDGGEIVFGDDVFLNNYSSITCRGKIQIGENTLIGESVKIYDHDHVFSKQGLIRDQGFKIGSVVIGKNVWIGSNVTILRDTVIGDNSVVGAGCVLKGTYKEGSIIRSNADITESIIITKN
ncbi:acyltransferase [Pseudoalteromonas sp. B28]